MIIGVPKEIKDNEYRVGLVPAGVRTLVDAGHEVLVECGAGLGSGIPDGGFQSVGAKLVEPAGEVYDRVDMIVKVKEPIGEEVDLLREGQALFCFLHLASAPELTHRLAHRGIIGIAYETVRLLDGSLPLLAPMSEVAGRLAIQVAIHCLQRDQGGRGILLGGVPGVRRGKVTVLGGGMVGINAVRVAVGLGAEVDVLDIDVRRLTYIYDIFRGEVGTLMANASNIERSITESDVIVGGVLVPGARAPRLVSRAIVASMKPGSVIVDVSVDQGGCVETIHPTTHSHPTYQVDGVIHYGVSNMPGAVPRTSTFGLTNVTLPYVLEIAEQGVDHAIREDHALRGGVNLYRGDVTCAGVAEAVGLPVRELEPR